MVVNYAVPTRGASKKLRHHCSCSLNGLVAQYWGKELEKTLKFSNFWTSNLLDVCIIHGLTQNSDLDFFGMSLTPMGYSKEFRFLKPPD